MIAEFQRSLGSVVNWRGPVSRKGWGWGAVGRPWLRSPIRHQKIGGGEGSPRVGAAWVEQGREWSLPLSSPAGSSCSPGLGSRHLGPGRQGRSAPSPTARGRPRKGGRGAGCLPRGSPAGNRARGAGGGWPGAEGADPAPPGHLGVPSWKLGGRCCLRPSGSASPVGRWGSQGGPSPSCSFPPCFLGSQLNAGGRGVLGTQNFYTHEA